MERVFGVDEAGVGVLEREVGHLGVEGLELVDGGERGPGELEGARGERPHRIMARVGDRRPAAFGRGALRFQVVAPLSASHGRPEFQFLWGPMAQVLADGQIGDVHQRHGLGHAVVVLSVLDEERALQVDRVRRRELQAVLSSVGLDLDGEEPSGAVDIELLAQGDVDQLQFLESPGIFGGAVDRKHGSGIAGGRFFERELARVDGAVELELEFSFAVARVPDGDGVLDYGNDYDGHCKGFSAVEKFFPFLNTCRTNCVENKKKIGFISVT